MRASYRFAFVLSVCLLLVAPLAVFGQTTGTIEGQVTDQGVPGVLPVGVAVHQHQGRSSGTGRAVLSDVESLLSGADGDGGGRGRHMPKRTKPATTPTEARGRARD